MNLDWMDLAANWNFEDYITSKERFK
jgi:hypothetical protein